MGTETISINIAMRINWNSMRLLRVTGHANLLKRPLVIIWEKWR